MKKEQKFTIRNRVFSILHAYNGLLWSVKKEHNFWIHIAATAIVVLLSVLLNVNTIEVIVLVFCVGFVWATELINTAIEHIMDFICPDEHPAVKKIKDISAATVLIAATTTAIIGGIIFIPKII